MSLIEAALEKLRKRAESDAAGVRQSADTQVHQSTRGRAIDLQPAVVEAPGGEPRIVPVAKVDSAVMERSGVLLNIDDPAAQSSYRILRTRVLHRMQAHDWRFVAVTAAGVSDGKTLTSINLAISLAKDVDTSVYLVDLDLQHPKVASYLGMEFDKDLSDYLVGAAGFEEILYSPGVERLTVLPNRRAMQHSSDLLGGPRVRELCKSLAAERPQPIVIFDLPPLLLTDDVLKFAPSVDCTLFVVSEGMTSRTALQRAREILQERNLLGVVLNRSTEREGSGYY